MSALTNYFTDIGMNCHIVCVLSGLEETLPVRLLVACSFIQCILFILIIFSFPFLVFYVISASPFQTIFIAKFSL